MEEKKRLTRSDDKMIGGVCAGLADGSFRRIRYTALRHIMVDNA